MEITKIVGNSLNNIVTNVKRVTDLVAEISAASQEQADGVNQINVAVNQMDQVTQQNASSAEQSAAASEELSAQAESLTGIVDDLTNLVGINGGTDGHHTQAIWGSAMQHRMTNMMKGVKEHTGAGKASHSEHRSRQSTRRSHHTTPKDEIIPMDDNAFKGF